MVSKIRDEEETLRKVNPVGNRLEIKIYKIRWFILLIYFFYTFASTIQWVQYSVITNIVTKYYGVSSLAINWTTIIGMLLYPPLLIPGCYIIDKWGLRTCALIGVIGTTIGAWIKVFSTEPDQFWIGFLGQTIVMAIQILILAIPAKIAAVWFGENEVSSATSIGVIASQLGTALGFILPTLLVKNHDNLEEIGKELSIMFYSVAIFTTPAVILVFVYFKAQPEIPPSIPQAYQRLNTTEINMKNYWKTYKELFTNKAFLFLSISFGINIGAGCGFITLLNQFITTYFENSEEDAGRMGLLLTITGSCGSMLFGIILDKTKKFKECSIALYIMTIVSILIFAFALESKSKWFVYITICCLGFFQTACCPVVFEFAAELTYPHPESTTSGITQSFGQGFGVLLTLILGKILEKLGVFWAIILTIPILLIGLVLNIIIPNDLRRQKIAKDNKNNVEVEYL